MQIRTWAPRAALAGLVLAVLVAAGVPARAIDPKYFPTDTEAIFTVNLKAILDSDLAKKHKDLVEKAKKAFKEKLDESPVKDYFEKAGFDLFRDLHSVSLASNGGKDTDKLFLVIEGKFDTDKLLDVARGASEVKIGKIGSVPTLEISPQGGDNKTIHAGIINDSVIIAAGSRGMLTEAVTRATAAKPAVRPALRKLLESTKATQALSIVVTANGIANGLNDAPAQLPENITDQLGAIDGLSINLTVAKDVSFQMAADVKSKESAESMQKALNFGLLLMRGMIGKRAENDEKAQLVLDLANTLRVAQMGQNVTLRGEISPENFDRILELMPKKE